MRRRDHFLHGMRDGLPIGIGYFAVAIALGIKALAAGISPFESALMSLLNLTSAGEAAGVVMLGMGTTYVELAFTQLVINLRYLLMSCSLSQKILPSTSLLHRLLISYGVTDEIFGASIATDGTLSPYYSYGVIAMAAPGWTIGTLLGALLGSILPTCVVTALGVALYAMFLAVVLPPAKKSRAIALVVGVSMAASLALDLLCRHIQAFHLSEGMRIILLTVLIAGGAAVLFPIKEESEGTA